MGDFIAEASVLITPDTTKFRAALLAEITAATKGITVPIPVVAAPSGAGTAAAGEQAAANQLVTQALREEAVQAGITTAATDNLSRSQLRSAAAAGQVERAFVAQAAGLAGLRGAVLASSTAFIGGTVAAVAFAKAVQSAASLESELNVLAVTAGATADQMERARQEALALGADITLPAVSANDAAEAFTNLSKAGLSFQESISGARGVLQLATAAQIDNAEATEFVATALNAFNLAGTEATHVADLLANASIFAQGSIEDVGIAFRQVAAVADQVGLSLDDTITNLALLQKAGLRASDAGTSLRVALLRLVSPRNKEAAETIRQLGIEIFDAQGKMRPDVFIQLGSALDGLSRKQQATQLFTIFGQDAQRAAAILTQQTVPSLNAAEDAMGRTGTAAEIAGARMAGFAGQVEALRNNLATLGVTLGTVVIPPLSRFVQSINDVVTAAQIEIGIVQKVADAVRGYSDSLRDNVPFADKFLDRIEGVASRVAVPGGPPVAAARAVIELADAFTESADEIHGDTERMRREVNALFTAFQQAGGGETALNELVVGLEKVADRLSKGDAAAQAAAKSVRAVIKEVLAAQGVPDTILGIQVKFDRSLVKQEARSAVDVLFGEFGSANTLQGFEERGRAAMEAFGRGAAGAAPAAAAGAADAFTLDLTTRIDISEATGTQQQTLSLLRKRLAGEEDFLRKLLAGQAGSSKNRIELIRKTSENIKRDRAAIQAILDEQARDAKEAAADIVQARNKADQAIIDAIGLREGRLQNALIIAQATEGIQDDLAAQIALRNFYARKLREVQTTVKDAKTRAQIEAQLLRSLIQARLAVREAQRQLREQQRQEIIEARAEARERADLAVQIAEAHGNTSEIRRALQNEIALLRAQIKGTRAGSIERQRLILLLAQKEAELRELNKRQREINKTQQELLKEQEFAFLQAQQGFAANLLGNLIPLGAAGGLVGATAPTATGPVLAPIRPEVQVGQVGAARAAAERGVSTGQGNSIIQILRGILDGINELNGRRQTPEATNQQRAMYAAMDNFPF